MYVYTVHAYICIKINFFSIQLKIELSTIILQFKFNYNYA